jgi:3-phosphoshikimate 1-carboxyvinyltransferase
MPKSILINKKINSFKKKINVNPDKSLSIRFAILASLAIGKSKAFNLSDADDIKTTLACLKKLGVPIKFTKNYCEITGKGLFNYKYKKNLTLNAGNSGTAARLISSILIKSPEIIKITGDQSLKKRDMTRIIEPLKKFGARFKKNNGKLPLSIRGSKFIHSINYQELRGSAQVKSACCLAALASLGTTKLKCKTSRNHTELLLKYLKVPIVIKKTKKYDFIKIKGGKKIKSFNYKLSGDISSASFLIVLTLLSEKSQLTIKNVNVNPTRTGIISILNKMGASIKLKNKRSYKGEQTADIITRSVKNLKAINLPKKFNNSSAIDEFLLIFICCAFARGTSTFRGLEELNKKESKRLDWGFKILKMIGIKTKKINNHGIKIFGNPDLELKNSYVIKNYLKDHRIAMCTTILALAKGGRFKIYDPDSIKTSFPSFLGMIKELGGKVN